MILQTFFYFFFRVSFCSFCNKCVVLFQLLAVGSEIGLTTKSLKQFYERESNETYIFVQIVMSTTRQYNIISSSSFVANQNDFRFIFFFVVSFDSVCVRWFVLSLALRVQKSSSPSLQHGFVFLKMPVHQFK